MTTSREKKHWSCNRDCQDNPTGRTFFSPTITLMVLLAGLVLFLSTIPGVAQGVFGTISGVVTDSTGAVLPGAQVKVTNVNTGVVNTYKTNSVGAYNATSLIPGVYRVEALAPGFKTAVVSSVNLEATANPKVDLSLQVGQSSQQITVTAESPVLQTQESSIGQTVTQRQLEQLPTESDSGRNIFSLIPLAAGVSQQKGGGGYGNDNMRINGDRPRDQDYILDGTTIEAPVFGGQTLSPSVDSIQEFRVEENSMSAEYGKTGGGVITAVTKSGTNQFHGSAYGYNRNEKLDARNYFESSGTRKNPYNYNEFGGTIGGPIVRNKLFFFTDYQGIRSHGSTAVVGSPVPDAAFRSGDLSALCTAGFDANGTCANSQQQVYYPGTTTPVPYNKIPASQISPIAQKFLAIIPSSPNTANVPGTDLLSYSSPFTNDLNRINPRVDFDLSSSDHVFGAYHRETGPNVGYDLIIGPAGEAISETNNVAASVGWTHSFSSYTLNDFHIGYMRHTGDRATNGQGFVSPADFGINGIPNCIASLPNSAGGTKCGTPGLVINGYSSLASGGTLFEPARTWQFADIVSKQAGRHSLRIGGEARHYAIDNYQPEPVTGNFTFNGSETGNGFADFLFGVVSNGSSVQVQNAMVSSREWSYAFFVQDDFKMTSRLTLNLGLRYQIDPSFHETHNGDAFFNPYTAKWEQFGVNAPSTPFDTSWTEFGPRVGFAWNPRGGFVIHGGYGIMYPGAIGHGRAGDGQPGPNLLATTPINGGTNWAALPTITSPATSAIDAPIPVNSDVSFASWAPRKQVPPYMQLWNLTIEQQLGASTVVSIGYIGSHGTHLPVNYAYNLCQQTPQSAATQGYNATTSPYCPNAAAAVIAGGGSIWDLVINPGWWGLSSSVYHAMQAKVDHRFSHNFSLLANFTWSKLMDDSSSDWGGFGSLDVLGQDFYNRRSERSISQGDIPARLTIAPIVQLPFQGHGWLADEALGGWRVSGIYTISSGYPFGITDNSYGYCNAAHLLEDRPMMIGNPLPPGFHQTVQHWFNTAAFDFSGTCPAAGLVDLTGPGDPTKAFGDSPRFFSNLRVPGVNNVDFSMQKDFKLHLGEQGRLTFQADAFDVLNHPQFGPPASDPTSSNFGQIVGTSLNNRTLQLGLHLYF